MKDFLFPIITIVLLFIFYLALPDVSKIALHSDVHKLCKLDAVIILIISIVFGIVDFLGLGDNYNPETFVNMSDETISITFDEPECIDRIILYTGIGSGQYFFEYSEDGQTWQPLTTYSQSSAEVLKWEYIEDLPDTDNIKYIRLYASGNVYLGELAFENINGNLISFISSNSNICDEQTTVRATQTYMNSTYFDEIYHARTAWEHLNNIYPYEISHPPLGKIIISLGIAIFGMNPFGWRFMGTLFGVLMLPVLYIFSKKLFGSTRVSTCTTLILATEFMHFTQTRIATIDTYAVFFILVMYLFMYEYITTDRLLYLGLSGLFFGIGVACKWTCIYAGCGLALIWLIYRLCKLKNGIIPLLKNILFCIVFFILIPVIIYCLSYIPYALAEDVVPIFSSDFYRIIIENQKFMFTYHTGLVAEHPYSSMWYQWIFDLKPILYYLQYNADGTRQSFGAFLNPILCWGGLVALFVLLYYAVAKREKIAIFILIGYLAQLVPWMFVKRLTFEYHYFACSVFLVLAVGYIFALMEKGTKQYKIFIYTYVLISCSLFVMFYPVLSGVPIKESVQAALLSWLPLWPF